jgi:putative ABC transport system permease protein
MMRPRWRKVISDLWDSKLRTLLVVLSIAVGVFSVGMIAGAYAIISNDMSASYAANRPANIELRMDNFDEALLSTVQNSREVADAEGRRVFNIRVRPVNGNKWITLDIVAIDDFEKNTINLLNPVSGLSAPGKRQILLERDAFKQLGVAVGSELALQLPDGTTKTMPVVGVVQDPTTGADDFLAPPLAYVTLKTLTYLQQPELYNRIYATVAEGQDDEQHIRNVAADLKDKIENSGYTVQRMRFSKTHEHPLASTVNAILGILLALGVLIVLLSSSLIANTLSALLNQHLRHIGVMKLVGGQDRQIFGMYLVLILSFGVLALLIAVPLGGQGAYGLSLFIADKMGFNLLGYRIVPLAFVIQIAIGLLVPLAAGFVPIINGSRITVLKAISGDTAQGSADQAEGDSNRGSRFVRFQMRATAALARRGIHIPRPLLISMRNTFRRRGRLILTLFTLTMAGAIFIAVFNVRVTLHDYIGQIGRYFLADVTLDFDQPYRLHEIEQYAMQVPGVQYVEGWQFVGAEILFPNGSVADNLNILAPPADSKLVSPILVAGRWIRANDVRKMAISEAVLSEFPDLKPGDSLRLRINGKNEDWEVVGIFKFVGREGILAYAPYDFIAQKIDLVNRSYSYRVVTVQHDRAYQEQMSEQLDHFFREKGFNVRQARPGLETLDTASESLDILVTFLLIMALLTATVGSMGLAGTMGMNVLERTREIGIMRAVGATNRVIIQTVVVEGMTIGSISWVLAVLLSIPFTVLLSTIVSLAVFETPIDLVFTPTGYIIWLVLALVLAAIASVLPARNAARLTIREVLAYE